MYTDYTDEVDENGESYYSDEGGNNYDKEKIKKIAIIVIASVVALILILVIAKSCTKKTNDNPSSVVDNNQTPSIIVSRETITLGVGEEQEIEATVIMATGSKVINWLSEDSSIATIDDIGNGKANVVGVKEGVVNVVATYRAPDGTPYTNKCVVTVTSSAKELKSINIAQESITLAKGSTVLLQISTDPSDARADNLIYSSDNSSIASVSETGKVTAVGVGTTTITVKTRDGKISDSVTVTVTNGGVTVINPTSIVISNLKSGLTVGSSAKISYEILPSNATNKKVTWTSSNPNIAKVSSDGTVTGVSAGKCKIIGSTSNNVSDSIDVTVESSTVHVSSISSNIGSSINMTVNGTKLFTYTVYPNNATNKDVVFTTSNSGVAFVNSYGIIAARSAGTATITVTTRDGNKTASVKVIVTGSAATGTTTGSSTGSSGSGSSGSSSGGSSSSSGSSGSTTGNTSCTDSSITNIHHNGSSSGAKVSSISFNNAKAFTMSSIPIITIDEIASCLDKNSVNYSVYYGTSSSNISSTPNAGQAKASLNTNISLNKGNGYYRIKITGKLNNSQVTLTKNYYAIVNKSGEKTAPIINYANATKTSSSSLKINISINETGSGLKEIKYCLTSSTTSCDATKLTLKSFSPVQKGTSIVVSTTASNSLLSSFKKACFNAYDNDGNKSRGICVNIA